MAKKDTASELRYAILTTGNNFIWLVISITIIFLAMFVLCYFQPESTKFTLPLATLILGVFGGKKM
jgi:hypothetical protein